MLEWFWYESYFFILNFSYLGELPSVRRYLEAHYLIVDAQLTDRVTVQEAPEYRSLPMDGENFEPAAMT